MLEILVEERSAAEALRLLVPKIVPGAHEGANFAIREFSGKQSLLKKLPDRLRGYGHDPTVRVLVLVDRDNQDCRKLKKELDRICESVGYAPNPLLRRTSK